jgi:hypothetical protein
VTISSAATDSEGSVFNLGVAFPGHLPGPNPLAHVAGTGPGLGLYSDAARRSQWHGPSLPVTVTPASESRGDAGGTTTVTVSYRAWSP